MIALVMDKEKNQNKNRFKGLREPSFIRNSKTILILNQKDTLNVQNIPHLRHMRKIWKILSYLIKSQKETL